jgi:phosphoserine phosphatase
MNDRWMLETVGRPVAVNPSKRMEALARRRGWAILAWAEKNMRTIDSGDESEKVIA